MNRVHHNSLSLSFGSSFVPQRCWRLGLQWQATAVQPGEQLAQAALETGRRGGGGGRLRPHCEALCSVAKCDTQRGLLTGVPENCHAAASWARSRLSPLISGYLWRQLVLRIPTPTTGSLNPTGRNESCSVLIYFSLSGSHSTSNFGSFNHTHTHKHSYTA